MIGFSKRPSAGEYSDDAWAVVTTPGSGDGSKLEPAQQRRRRRSAPGQPRGALAPLFGRRLANLGATPDLRQLEGPGWERRLRRWSIGALAAVGVLLVVVLGTRALSPSAIDVNASLVTAASAAHVGDFKQCVATYTVVLEHAPRSVTAYAGRAGCSLSLGDGSGAIQDLNQALTLSPMDPGLHLLRAQAYARLGNSTSATGDFVAVVRSEVSTAEQGWNAVHGLLEMNVNSQAVSAATRLAQIRPNDWYALDALASAEAAVGDSAASQRAYSAAFKVGDHLQQGTSMAEQAEALRNSGDLNAALRDAATAVTLNPRWEFYRLRAQIRQAVGDAVGADSDYGSAISTAMTNWWIDQTTTVISLLDERAHVRLSEGLVSSAAADIRLAIARAPNEETRKALQAELSSITGSP